MSFLIRRILVHAQRILAASGIGNGSLVWNLLTVMESLFKLGPGVKLRGSKRMIYLWTMNSKKIQKI